MESLNDNTELQVHVFRYKYRYFSTSNIIFVTNMIKIILIHILALQFLFKSYLLMLLIPLIFIILENTNLWMWILTNDGVLFQINDLNCTIYSKSQDNICEFKYFGFIFSSKNKIKDLIKSNSVFEDLCWSYDIYFTGNQGFDPIYYNQNIPMQTMKNVINKLPTQTMFIVTVNTKVAITALNDIDLAIDYIKQTLKFEKFNDIVEMKAFCNNATLSLQIENQYFILLYDDNIFNLYSTTTKPENHLPHLTVKWSLGKIIRYYIMVKIYHIDKANRIIENYGLSCILD